MTDDHRHLDWQAAIDRHLESAVESGDPDRLAPVQTALDAGDDRWYGRLLVGAYESVAGPTDAEAVPAAAAAVELLRGYCRSRSELLAEVADGERGDRTASLLAGDCLYSAAYATLGAVDHPQREPCFEVLTDVSETMVEGFASHYAAASTADPAWAVIDDTVGALAEGAVVIGVTLAGVERAQGRFATVGRGLGACREVQQTLADGGGSITLASQRPDERALRQYAQRRFAAADEALQGLSPVADVASLRRFLTDVEAAPE